MKSLQRISCSPKRSLTRESQTVSEFKLFHSSLEYITRYKLENQGTKNMGAGGATTGAAAGTDAGAKESPVKGSE